MHYLRVQILLSIWVLLQEPNPADPLEPAIAKEYLHNRKLHDDNAREWTEKFAKKRYNNNNSTNKSEDSKEKEEKKEEQQPAETPVKNETNKTNVSEVSPKDLTLVSKLADDVKSTAEVNKTDNVSEVVVNTEKKVEKKKGRPKKIIN